MILVSCLASESSSSNQLIALGLIAIGFVTIVGAVFLTRNGCAQPTDRLDDMVATIASSAD
jgi:hypothetical protein